MKNKVKILFSSIIIIISLICMVFVFNMNIIPNKYLILFISLMVILNLLCAFLLFRKSKILNIIGIILYIILIGTSSFGIYYSSKTINFLNEKFNKVVEVSKYDVIVLKDSNYKKLNDLKNKNIGYLNINTNIKNLNLKANYTKYNINDLYNKFINGNIDSMIINDSYLDILEDIYEGFSKKIKIIYSYDIKKTKKTENNIKLKSTNIYLSGSDSRSDTLALKSRSDVNMIITINPYTHTILLTSIPRDYYVQLHGTTGLKDKLTHSGIYGMDMGRQTLEDLFNIKIDYSIKVGMPAVPKIVDLIDGVDIDSDRTFSSFHIKGWTVEQGINHMNGKQALAYARERYAYPEGDIHRIQNQQQVLEAIFNKIISNKKLLLKYDDILDSFSELYSSDIPKDYISKLIKEEIETGKSWKIEKQYVTGQGTKAETYSMPGMNLYVMNPDMNSVNEKAAVINEAYNKNND